MIIDDYSNYTWILFLENKDEVLNKFNILRKKLENQLDCSIVSIKTNHSINQHICLTSMVDNSTLWHRRLGHANMRLVQNLASNELVRNLPKLSFDRHYCDTYLGSQGLTNNMNKREVTTSKVLELMHLDFVWSISDPKLWRKLLYFNDHR
jgi:aspartate ammonia-lyase